MGVFPLNADGSPQAQDYIERLTPKQFTDIEKFLAREGHRYGLALEEPVHLELYPQGKQLPPALPSGAGPFGIAWWSLKMRWFAMRATSSRGMRPRASASSCSITTRQPERVPDSHGLQKGLIGVVHAFADDTMTGANSIDHRARVPAHRGCHRQVRPRHRGAAVSRSARRSGPPAAVSPGADRDHGRPPPRCRPASGKCRAA